jgi:hypothetical protein
LVGKPEGKRPVRRPSHMWVGNVKLDLGKIWWCCMQWIYVA